MVGRDSVEAMRARIEALERELSDVAADGEAEKLRLERELAEARLELAKERERAHRTTTAPKEVAAPSASGGKKWLALIPLVVIGLVVAGYLGSRPSFGGALEVRSPSEEPWTFQPTVCRSGDAERPSFFGALLRDPRNATVQIQERSVSVSRPGRAPLVLTRSECDQFDVHVEWGVARVERVESVDGHARLRCTVDGTEVSGELAFETCSQ